MNPLKNKNSQNFARSERICKFMKPRNIEDEDEDMKSDYGNGFYSEKKPLDVFFEKAARACLVSSECMSNTIFTHNGQNFSRIMLNVVSCWVVLFSWVFFITVASIKGMIWYQVFPGLVGTGIFIISLLYLTVTIRSIVMRSTNVPSLYGEEYVARFSAETLILVTVIIGFFPIVMSLLFAIIDTHNDDDVVASICSMIQCMIIYGVTFGLWIPYAFCANPRKVFDSNNF